MRFVKWAFWISLAIWLLGGLLTMEYASPTKRIDMLAHGVTESDVTMLNLRGISINLFGPITAILGLLLAGAWLYKKSNSKNPPTLQDKTEALSQRGATEKVRTEPPLSPHPVDSPSVSCNFSGWARDKNRIVQQYDYRGQGLNHKLVIELTVEKGSIGIHRFIHFWLSPAVGDQGLGDIKLTAEGSGESSGWLPSMISTAAGGSTLMDIRSREGADAVFRLLSAGCDLEFAARLNGESLLSLPMPNNAGVRQHYEAILSSQLN